MIDTRFMASATSNEIELVDPSGTFGDDELYGGQKGDATQDDYTQEFSSVVDASAIDKSPA